MAKTEKRARERTVSSSYFLACFGLSRKIYADKATVAAEEGGEMKMKKKKKPSRWLLCSKFRSKNREIKPAPIDEETERTTSSVENETDKKKPVSLISRMATDRTNLPTDDKAVNQEIKETQPRDLQRDVPTDRSKPIEQLDTSREDACPEQISNANPSGEKTGSRVGIDPVIGISVVILTLVIMLIWGRVFAILCTSAWCYSLPRLRNAAALVKRSANDGSAFVQGLSSGSCKIKVVSDVLLGRQNRVSL
ncbi:hypothetical protein HA466_0269100 [Hirschfeldia incana]|nr:hypothetical protein HA466_0269100 [Hirschfeldia incana]